MDQARLLDRVRWGMNIAARTIGAISDLHRPRGPLNPIAPDTRILRLHAAFTPRRGNPMHTNPYGEPLWLGTFDSAYTKTGDYLVQSNRTLFIASQNGLAEPLCVLTNRVVTISRALSSDAIGARDYPSNPRVNATILMRDWPASVLGISDTGSPTAGLPTDLSVPYWTILMPAHASLLLRPADFYTDDLGRTAVIAAAEHTELGWRMVARQVSA